MSEKTLIGCVILDHQYPFSSQQGLWSENIRRRRFLGSMNLDGKVELGPGTGITFHPDTATHEFAQALAYRQSQSGSPELTRGGGIDLLE